MPTKQKCRVKGQRNQKRLAKALMEILTNPETPDELEEGVSSFLCNAGSGSIIGRFTQVPGGLQALEHLLAFAEWQKAHEDWPGVERTLGATTEVGHATN